MRQVPYITESTHKKTFFLKQYQSISSTFAHIATILASQYLMIPMLSFVFFSSNSSLWAVPKAHHTQSIYYGFATTATVLGGFIAHTLLNHLSDSYGRVFGLCNSYIGILIGSGLGFYALYNHSPILFILAMFLMSALQVSKSMGYAAIGDRKDPATQFTSMAILQCVIAIGILIGSTISGHLAAISFHTPMFTGPFILAFIFAIVGLCVCIIHPPKKAFYKNRDCGTQFQKNQKTQIKQKTEKTENNEKTHQTYSLKILTQQYMGIIKTKHVMKLLIILILCQLSWGFYFEYMPPTLKIICHARPIDISHFIITVSLSLMIATTIIIQYFKKFFSMETIFKISLIMMISGFIITISILKQSQHHHFSGIYLAALLITSGDVIIYTILMNALASFIPSHAQGKLMGLDYIIITIVWSCIGLLGGWLLALNPHYPSYAFPIGIIILTIICFFNENMLYGLTPENILRNE